MGSVESINNLYRTATIPSLPYTGDVAHGLVSHNNQVGRILHVPHTRRSARANGLLFAPLTPPVSPRLMRGSPLRPVSCLGCIGRTLCEMLQASLVFVQRAHPCLLTPFSVEEFDTPTRFGGNHSSQRPRRALQYRLGLSGSFAAVTIKRVSSRNSKEQR